MASILQEIKIAYNNCLSGIEVFEFYIWSLVCKRYIGLVCGQNFKC